MFIRKTIMYSYQYNLFVEKIEFLIFNSIYHDYNKNCAFYQKMVKIKTVDFFEMNNFTC